jgi:hypothetical protein
MCSTIGNPTSCEIHAASCILYSENMSVAEIHHKLCSVHSLNIMHEGILRQWCRMFTVKSKVVSRPSVVSNDSVQSVDPKICEW